MPRKGESGTPEWVRLYEVAEAQEGYVTTAQANEAGYSNPLLHYHVRQGRLERVGRGIYRLGQFPAGQHEDLVVVWLWSDQEGVFSHETALVLYELSDALPDQRHLTVPSSWADRRLRVPTGTTLSYGDVGQEERAWVGAVPVTSPLRTVVDCATAGTDPGLVGQAIEQGLTRGMVDKEALRRALVAADLPGLLPLLGGRSRKSHGRRGPGRRATKKRK